MKELSIKSNGGQAMAKVTGDGDRQNAFYFLLQSLELHDEMPASDQLVLVN